MALTNFTRLTNEQLTVWSRQLWKYARNYMFVNKFAGTGPNNMIQITNDLKKSQKGTRAVITLLADLQGDGIAGDRTLEGNEEALRSFEQVITIDQLRHANRLEGRMADQASVVEFRNNSRDVLAYWLSDRVDQLAFLTLSGVSYSRYPNGNIRVGSDLPFLDFAKDVTPPTSQRRARWNGTSKTLEIGGGTNTLTANDTPSWEMFVQAKAFLKDQYVRNLKGSGGTEYLHAFLTPQAMARLKLDPTYMQAVRTAQKPGNRNPLFTGDAVEVDGIVIHDFRHVVNTSMAPSGSKWGTDGTVDGCQVLFCGAQALAMADIGNPYWVEEEFDYGNQNGISVGKMFGFLKPKFTSMYSGDTVQDFGVFSVYVAQ